MTRLKVVNLLFALFLSFLLIGCDSDKKNSDDAGPLNLCDISVTGNPSITLVDEFNMDDWDRDPYTFSKVYINGDLLYLETRYGGGCELHDFSLVASSGFMKSNPVQSEVLLTHNDNNDGCEALITRTLIFNLSPLKEIYLQRYPDATRTIILLIEGWDDNIEYQF